MLRMLAPAPRTFSVIEQPLGLLGEDGARRMVLDGMEEAERHTGPVAQDEAVAGRAVVVRGHEILDVEAARPARGQDHGLGLDDEVLLGLEVVEDGPGTGALFVQDELDGGRELQDLDVVGVVLDLVAEGPHHLGAGDVAGIMHALPRRAAAVHGLEASVLVLGEHRPQFFQPGHDLGRLDDQRFDELGVVLEVAAAHDVQVVVIGGVLLGLGRGLDAALGHHRVGVADAELGGDEDAGPVLPGQEGRRRARATAADDEDVGLVIDVTEVDRVGI